MLHSDAIHFTYQEASIARIAYEHSGVSKKKDSLQSNILINAGFTEEHTHTYRAHLGSHSTRKSLVCMVGWIY